jgi:DNA repair exonuclease SbcCD ATPase subunit
MPEAFSLKSIESKFSDLTQRLGSVQGEYNYLNEEKNTLELNLISYEHDKETHIKAVELLTAVQKVSQEKIREGFETLITQGLQYVFENKCTFELNFGRRGNLQELDFNLKQPGFEEAYDILDTDSGGIINVVSITLRLVLMEINTPKITGFVLLDEPFTGVSDCYIERARDFIQQIHEKLKRQIIIISHEKVYTESNYNIIEIK